MQDNVEVLITAEDKEKIPAYASHEAAGADIRAHIIEPVLIKAGETVMVPTGLQLAIPPGYEVQIRPRSGLAAKHGLTVLNSPGTIDSDYRGEIKIILINHSRKDFTITRDMRIAQMVLAPVCQAKFVVCEELETTQRGSGGFGHTGFN